MKNSFIIFRNHSNHFIICQLGANPKYVDFYANIDNPDSGFDKAEVDKYKGRFEFADDLNASKKIVAKIKFMDLYGDGKSGDVGCPNCGFKFSLDYHDNNFECSAGIIEDFSKTIKCICGCKFRAQIDVKVTFSTKILDK